MVTLLTQHQAQHKKQYPWKVLLFNYHIFFNHLGFRRKCRGKKTTLEGVILSEGHTPNCISHRSFLCFLTPLKMPPHSISFFFFWGCLSARNWELFHASLNHESYQAAKSLPNSTSDKFKFYAKICWGPYFL